MRSEKHLVAIRLGIAAAFAVLACMPAAATGVVPGAEPVELQVQAAEVDDTADACVNFTPAQATDADGSISLAVLEVEATAAAARPKPCKACQDRPWCACTYNGQPRVSCNPCCYMHPYTGQQICLD